MLLNANLYQATTVNSLRGPVGEPPSWDIQTSPLPPVPTGQTGSMTFPPPFLSMGIYTSGQNHALNYRAVMTPIDIRAEDVIHCYRLPHCRSTAERAAHMDVSPAPDRTSVDSRYPLTDQVPPDTPIDLIAFATSSFATLFHFSRISTSSLSESPTLSYSSRDILRLMSVYCSLVN